MTVRGLLSAMLLASLALPASAQFGSYPGQRYFAALDELHSGDFRRAERIMRTELRTAVKSVDSRWLDSICYGAGLGEALYQQGRLEESLAQFDGVLDLFLGQAAWMRQISFRQTPREDVSLARRLPPWVRRSQPVTYADVPRSFLYQFGRLDNSAAAQQGGTIQQAQFWKLDAEEVARSIAWTLYRRGELLGPLGAYDARNDAVANRLAGGGLGPAGHWTGAWVELWWGLAEGSSGDALEALPHLQQAVKLGGRYEHRLSGLALLTQARLAIGAGDAPLAARHLQEAIASGVAYDDFSVVAEATRALHDLATINPTVPKPPLAVIADWAERRGIHLVAIDARLGQIEDLIVAGDAKAGSEMLGGIFRRSRDARAGLLGREGDRLMALAGATTRRYDAASKLASDAIAAQAGMSRRLLQTRLANQWFDDGRLSARRAKDAYAEVLADPSPAGWMLAPLDSVTAMSVPETDTFDRWFATAVERRDASLALRIIDQQRRREYLAGQPLGGRLVAVRWLLESPDDRLSPEAIGARSRVDASVPDYRNLRRDGSLHNQALIEAVAATEDATTPAIRKASSDLAETLLGREQLILRSALSRAPTPLVFPPPVDLVAAKNNLIDGDAVLAFHNSRDETFGVVFTATGDHLWHIGPTKRVAAQVERVLREVVGTSPRQTWSAEELAEAKWRAVADELSELLLADSRLDAPSLKRLWVVPDGSLWRLPFELLKIPGGEATTESTETISYRYAPTPGWALRSNSNASPAVSERPTWQLAVDDKRVDDEEGADRLATAVDATPPPRGMTPDIVAVKAIAGHAVIDVGGQPPGLDPLGTPLAPPSKGRTDAGAWARLPFGGTDTVVLRGLGGGEAGGANGRRSRDAIAFGTPELHLACSLLAGGTSTVLLERWPSGGQRSDELVAEWLNGLSRMSAIDSWSRSKSLALSEPLNPAREPRLAAEAGTAPDAKHPFWWSAYLLID
ncbi:MAG: CHAT domain-containing protein [Planctomycetota bacterium]